MFGVFAVFVSHFIILLCWVLGVSGVWCVVCLVCVGVINESFHIFPCVYSVFYGVF